MYLSIMYLEGKRLAGLSHYLLVCILLAALFHFVAIDLVSSTSVNINWLGCACLLLPINQCYEVLFSPSWARIVKQNKSLVSIHWVFVGISLCLNLPIAIVLNAAQAYSIKPFLLTWLILDITGYLLHIIRRVATSQLSMLIGYLLWLPTIYPWIMWGQLAEYGNTAALKLLIGIWLLCHLKGPKLFMQILKVTVT